jgi:hypothetical protein
VEEILALDNRERVIAILRDVFGRRGGTKSEIMRIAKDPYEVNPKTFYRVWNELVEKKVIGQVVLDDRPTSNFALVSLARFIHRSE